MVKEVKAKVKLIGSGALEDPFRIPLPTYYRILEVDYERKEATVEVPDEYFKKTIVRPDGTVEELETDEIQVEKLRLMYRRVWDRFKEHEPQIKEARRVG